LDLPEPLDEETLRRESIEKLEAVRALMQMPIELTTPLEGAADRRVNGIVRA